MAAPPTKPGKYCMLDPSSPMGTFNTARSNQVSMTLVSLFFSLKTTMGESDVENTWSSLKNCIQEILKKRLGLNPWMFSAAGFSFFETHENAHNMVLHKHGEKLYNGIKEVVTHHLESIVIFLSTYIFSMVKVCFNRFVKMFWPP